MSWDAKPFSGPWEVGPYATDIWAPSAKGGQTKVCDIRGWGYLTGSGHGALGLSKDEAIAIQTANARLIAAAPEMLEALQYIFDHIADPERGPRDLYPAFGLNSSRAVDLVRAAIAKATGTRE